VDDKSSALEGLKLIADWAKWLITGNSGTRYLISVIRFRTWLA